jgi:hypothetical protein
VWLGLTLAAAATAAALPGHTAAWNLRVMRTTTPAPLFTAVDLTPRGFSQSWATGVSQGQQVGYGSGPATGNRMHALWWRGDAARVVDLNPGGFDASWAVGISDGMQVGAGRGPEGAIVPLLWRGTAAGVVNLHPDGFGRSQAMGVSGRTQVGWGEIYGGYQHSPSHALLWRGAAANVVDLHPAGFDDSWAVAISGSEEVGMGDQTQPAASNAGPPAVAPARGAERHALLWRGSAGSLADLHPRGFDLTWAVAAVDGQQVGYGEGPATGGQTHALLWRGSAASVVDLHAFLPPGFTSSSASGINPRGDIVGVASGPASGNRTHAFLWHSRTGVAVDLEPFLPAGFVSSSAVGIDANGDIVGSAAKANEAPEAGHAILWRPALGAGTTR